MTLATALPAGAQPEDLQPGDLADPAPADPEVDTLDDGGGDTKWTSNVPASPLNNIARNDDGGQFFFCVRLSAAF